MGLCSIGADWLGERAGQNKTEPRRTGDTCGIGIQKNDWFTLKRGAVGVALPSFLKDYLTELVDESRMRPAECGL